MGKNLLSRAAFVVLCAGFASSVLAADINVNDAASLKDAVANAAAGDVIKLAGGTYKLGNQLEIRKDITLVGTASNVVLDGEGKYRVLFVGSNSSVTVRNLIIQNGYAAGGSDSESGAGIRVDDKCTLTVDNCKFLDNNVEPIQANWTGGGAIHIKQDAKLIVDHSEFIGNSGFQGGAIVLKNTDADITNSYFERNRTYSPDKASKNGDCKGGAIVVRSDNGTAHTHNFTSTVFYENNSWAKGGAVSYNVAGGSIGQFITFRGCSFIRNTTNVDLENPQRTDANDGSQGGAFFIDCDGKECKLNFYSCTIAQNYAANNGGGLAISSMKNSDKTMARFVHCTITDNHNINNSGNGAGLWINTNEKNGGMTIVNSIITGNWSMKMSDEGYDEDPQSHWEYSDLVINKEQEKVILKNNVIGYLRNGELFTGDVENNIIQFAEIAWQPEISEEDLLGELYGYDEDYYAYPFGFSAEKWFDGELGDIDLAKELDCPTDQYGGEWTVNCIGAIGGDLDYLEEYDIPVFFDEEKATSGIGTVAANGAAKTNGAIYTLSGVRVAKAAAKGVYIRNGKKIVVGK